MSESFTARLIPVEVDETVTIPSATAGGSPRTITVKVPAFKDPTDGEIYLGTEATEILDKAKARHMGVLAPQELAAMRKRLGLSQSAISDLLQIGEKTWSRWETGREIPSRSMNLLLLALYEGKVSLPWLKAQRCETDSPAKTPELRAGEPVIAACEYHVFLSHTAAWLFRDENDEAVVAANAFSSARHFEWDSKMAVTMVDAPVKQERMSRIEKPRFSRGRYDFEPAQLTA